MQHARAADAPCGAAGFTSSVAFRRLASADSHEAILDALEASLDYHVATARLPEILEHPAMRSDSLLGPIRQRFRDDLAEILVRAAHARSGVDHGPLIHIALMRSKEPRATMLANGATKKA